MAKTQPSTTARQAVELSGAQTTEALNKLMALGDGFEVLASQLSEVTQVKAYEQQPSLTSCSELSKRVGSRP